MSSLLLIPSFLVSFIAGMILSVTRSQRRYAWIWGLIVVLAGLWVGFAMSNISLIGSAIDGRLVSSTLEKNGLTASVMNNPACQWLVFLLPSIPLFVTALLMFPERNKE